MQLDPRLNDRIPGSISNVHKIQEMSRIPVIHNLRNFEDVSARSKRSPDLYEGIRLKKMLNIGLVTVWLVDGCKVRTYLDIDFTCGGHGYRYLYIPLNEIWIDNGLQEADLGPTILHEAVERALMKDKMTYNDAHDFASKTEMMARQNGQEKIYQKNLAYITAFLGLFGEPRELWNP